MLGALVQAHSNHNQPVNKKAVACGPIKLDITAGCSKYITYTIKYYGTKPIKCHFYYKITPCEKLFKVKYSTSFVLKPGKNTFKVLVSPSFYSKPQAYHFYGYFFLGRYVLPCIKSSTINPPSGNIPEIIPPIVEVNAPQSSTNWLFYGMLFMCVIVIAFSLLFLNKKEERVVI